MKFSTISVIANRTANAARNTKNEDVTPAPVNAPDDLAGVGWTQSEMLLQGSSSVTVQMTRFDLCCLHGLDAENHENHQGCPAL